MSVTDLSGLVGRRSQIASQASERAPAKCRNVTREVRFVTREVRYSQKRRATPRASTGIGTRANPDRNGTDRNGSERNGTYTLVQRDERVVDQMKKTTR